MAEVDSFEIRKGTVINDYKIVKRLGKGWEGEVYQVVEEYSGGKRVLKIFNPAEYRSKQIGKYCSKFETLSGVQGVIRYYHAGYWEDRDAYYLVMEYFEGRDLGELSKKPWPVFKALRTVRKVCHIINDCHSEKICVGDLHAGNILVDSIGCIRIIDIDFEAIHNNEYAVQDVVSVSKLLYTLIGSADKLTDDLKKVLPMRADAIRNRYKSTQQVLDALDELMGK